MRPFPLSACETVVIETSASRAMSWMLTLLTKVRHPFYATRPRPIRLDRTWAYRHNAAKALLQSDRAWSSGKEKACRARSEEHTSELQSRQYLVCRLLLEKKKKINIRQHILTQ